VALVAVAALVVVPHYTRENWWYLLIHFGAWYAAGMWQGLLVRPRWYVRGLLAAPFCSAALVLVVAWRMDVGLTKHAAVALMWLYLAGLLMARGVRRPVEVQGKESAA
jgi:hypothetical protein